MMKKLFYILLFMPLSLLAQSNGENYVMTQVLKIKKTDINNYYYVEEDSISKNITYFDGFGRPKQNIKARAGGNKEHIITHIAYDEFGRQEKDYLPYAITDENWEIYRTNALTATNNYYKTNYLEDINPSIPNPFSKKTFEASPLNRVLEQAAPGEDWRSQSGHTVRFKHDYNQQEDKVLLFHVDNSNGKLVPDENFHFAPGELYKKITKDENWVFGKAHTTEEYKDKQGRVVLKRTYTVVNNSPDPHDTYYIYDDYGNLTYVLPPKLDLSNFVSDVETTRAVDIEFEFSYTHFLENPTTALGNEGFIKFKILVSDPSIMIMNAFATFDPIDELKLNDLFSLNFPPGFPTLPDGPELGNIDAYDKFGNISNYSLYQSNGSMQLFGSNNYPQEKITAISGFYSVNLVDIGVVLNASHFEQTTTALQADLSLISTDNLNALAFQYVYDDRNRLVEKKIPGKGWEYIVYNKLDRPILTQDAKMRLNNKWLFTKYDAFGRVTYTGMHTFTPTSSEDNGGRLELQIQVDNQTKHYELKGNTTIDNQDIEYTNQTLPYSNLEIHTINYYDDYNFSFPTELSYTDTFGAIQATNTTSLPTGSKIRVLDTNHWITSLTYYDDKARPIFSSSKNECLNTVDVVKSKLDFTGKVLETESTHTKDANTPIVVKDSFTYDHAQRLLTQTQLINENRPELIVNNTYDALGQLVIKKVGGIVASTQPENSQGLQTVDYKYNIRGWLKSINNGNTLNNDLFGFKLNYNTKDINTSTKLYNGNISETHWVTANDNQERSYSYNYDALNRIKKADYFGNYTVANANNDIEDFGLKSVDYDKNGNITNLKRSGFVRGNNGTGSNQINIIDDLTYTYSPSSNKLISVSDNATKDGFKNENITGEDYKYDLDGNMIIDKNKGITSIEYNHLNLPTRITIVKSYGSTTFTNYIDYTYDASGVKLMKKVSEDIGSYILTKEIAYSGNYIYKKSQGGRQAPRSPRPSFKLQFFNQPEGYVEPVYGVVREQGQGPFLIINATPVEEIVSFNYIYQYKDHLGNIRLSYSDADNNGAVDSSEILEENNYYPGGLKHKGYNNVINGTDHPYGFNGKEENDELGLATLDFGARNYDPALMRWMNLDPLADTYTSFSPYNYVANNPVFFVDPDGERIDISGVYKQDKDGNDVLDKKGNRILIGVNITVTGKLINESGTAFTDKQLSTFGTRLGKAIEGSFSSASEKGFKVNVSTDITVASGKNPLALDDHAFRIVDNGKLPDSNRPGKFRPNGVIGHASFGELGAYINADIVSDTALPETTGKYAGTGKTSTGGATLERTGTHELGHTGTLPHVTRGTMDSNLMHQTSQSNAGMKLSKAQILKMKEAYDKKQLNKGRQNYHHKTNKLVGPRKANGTF